MPIAVPAINDEDVEAVRSAVASGWVSGRGKSIIDFENQFAAWLNCKNAITCSSGTSALHLALKSAGVSVGDEVIIPTFSMAAIAFAVSYTGARIVLADSEMETWNVDPSEVTRKITQKTKAVIAMHTYGHPVDLKPLLEVCSKRNVILIEDAAEAHGSEYYGKKVGTIGDIGCFSFFSNKIITTGEGGAIVTSNDEIANMCRILRDMAFSKDPSRKFLHEYIGYNYRMTNMQAALGVSQLKRIQNFIDIRRENAQIYHSYLSKVPGIVLAPEAVWAKNVFWMYSILVSPDFGISRDQLMTQLSNSGIETRPFFVSCHQQPVFSDYFGAQSYPNSEKLSALGLNLPSGNTLTPSQVEYVSSAIASKQRGN